MEISEIEREIFCEVADFQGAPEGAYNFRVNGKSVGRKSTGNINIVPKKDNSGLDIYVKAGTVGETVHIPVAISVSGLSEVVYNDFHIGAGSDVVIIAGCGIYNCGGVDSRHDGVHRFFVENGAKVRYVEKHFGFGSGPGGKILNPVTELELADEAEAVLEMEQIKGVDSTVRETNAVLGDGAKLVVKERLMTHGRQKAESVYDVELKGRESAATIASRSIAQDFSSQVFKSRIVGENKCRGHSECDAILMDKARVLAVPSLDAVSIDAELIHEAAIGKIAGEQIEKLMTLGLTRAEAESQIINGFLK